MAVCFELKGIVVGVDRYKISGGKKLRCGYTTGSCAAAAAKAAAAMLVSETSIDHISLETPKGISLLLEIESVQKTESEVSCAVRKDGGDDIDATHGLLIGAKVSLNQSGKIVVDGGAGVGRVTRAGLDQPVGFAAINHVPRQMITENVRDVLENQFGQNSTAGADVLIFVPEGELIASQTYNPRLGIQGGISILGTTGIVEPMSESAIIDTIHTELRMFRAASDAPILITPGHYGEKFSMQELGLNLSRSVLCSNYLGDTLDFAAYLGFQGVLLIGHIGKLIKTAGGIFQTHSRVADARMEILAAHAAMAGGSAQLVREIMCCVTTDEATNLLKQNHLLKTVMSSTMQKIEEHLMYRAGKMQIEAVLFSNQFGVLGCTKNAAQLMKQFQQTEEPK